MPSTTVLRELSAAPDEFARGVRAAFADARPTASGWQVDWGAAGAEIELVPLPDLVIASLRLPRQRCRIVFSGDESDRQALLDRLDRYQQRGGG